MGVTAFFLAFPAFASAECEAMCGALDAVEERCEALHGDGGRCEDIGALEETCDPEDGGTTETCPTLCADVDALDDRCDAAYGADDEVCRGLDAIAEDCEDGAYDGGVAVDREDDDEDDAGEDEDDEASHDPVASCASGGGALAAAGLLFVGMAGRRRRGR